MNPNQIINALYAMDTADVRRINEAAYSILKGKRNQENRAAKSKLHVGQSVKFQGKHGYSLTGTIKKENRTRCVVDTGDLRNWTVPMTMLEVV